MLTLQSVSSSFLLATAVAFFGVGSCAMAQCNPDCQCQVGGQCSCEDCQMPHLAESPACTGGQCALEARPVLAHPVRSVLKVAAVPVKAVCNVAQRRPLRTLLRGAFCGRRCR